jgi:hypothetical protein
MKERPILFSEPMVQAILAGTKTQTRRVIKGAEDWDRDARYVRILPIGADGVAAMPVDQFWRMLGGGIRCHYGQPGDWLWVRETFMDLGMVALYRADPAASTEAALVAPGQPWRPSIFMPRSLSRIMLEITDIRVERLQDISESDAMAEGIVDAADGNGFQLADTTHYTGNPRDSYFSLWDDINGQGSVEANPWIWVIEFAAHPNNPPSAASIPAAAP